ncbi:MAG: LuxR family transcriptional regulator [Clostridiaceae bacterium]|nr:LuxR family transcriptional regulator [Clostridiaceae bacterium]
MWGFVEKVQQDQRKLSIICLSLVSGWLLAVPFEGQVLYTLMGKVDGLETLHNTVAIVAHFMGLFISGFLIKKQITAKTSMITSTVVCLCGSLIFFLPFSILWYISIVAISFFAGVFVACWGFYFRNYSKREQRFKTAADVLIYSNLFMILINGITVSISAFIGLTTAIIILATGLFLTSRLEASPQKISCNNVSSEKPPQETSTILKPLVTLCLFILIITVISGLMYQVVVPAFSHHQLLTSYYWAIPYIAALLFLKNTKYKINKAYILYIALTMVGFSYIGFMLLNRSVTSYFIINTLMLASLGVFDLFWWSVLGEFFEYSENPTQILGIGLSMNVLGITIGGLVGKNLVYYEGADLKASVIAVIIIFIIITILPILNMQLTRLLKQHEFLFELLNKKVSQQQEKDVSVLKDEKQLTARELEIVELLLKGYTYKGMSENLYVSENTIKYHVKNIYQKLNIRNKMELIRTFSSK